MEPPKTPEAELSSAPLPRCPSPSREGSPPAVQTHCTHPYRSPPCGSVLPPTCRIIQLHPPMGIGVTAPSCCYKAVFPRPRFLPLLPSAIPVGAHRASGVSLPQAVSICYLQTADQLTRPGPGAMRSATHCCLMGGSLPASGVRRGELLPPVFVRPQGQGQCGPTLEAQPLAWPMELAQETCVD